MNASIDARIRRVSVLSASREEFGGTRKYVEQGIEKSKIVTEAAMATGGVTVSSTCGGRVQTAAAFVALLRELGDEVEGARGENGNAVDLERSGDHLGQAAAVAQGLKCFTACYEQQIHRSRT